MSIGHRRGSAGAQVGGEKEPDYGLAMKVEYGVVVGAAVLLLTVPSVAARLLTGPISFLQMPLTLYDATYLAGMMGGFALLVGYLIHTREVGWERLGWRPRSWKRAVSEGVFVGLLIVGVDVIWLTATGEPLRPTIGAREYSPTPWVLLAAAYVIALPINSIGEEVLRAYVIRRGEDFGWPTQYAAFVSVLVFFSYHTYYAHNELLLVTVTGGVMLTAYYVMRRDLLGLIVAHTFINYVWYAMAL